MSLGYLGVVIKFWEDSKNKKVGSFTIRDAADCLKSWQVELFSDDFILKLVYPEIKTWGRLHQLDVKKKVGCKPYAELCQLKLRLGTTTPHANTFSRSDNWDDIHAPMATTTINKELNCWITSEATAPWFHWVNIS